MSSMNGSQQESGGSLLSLVEKGCQKIDLNQSSDNYEKLIINYNSFTSR